MHVLLSRLEAAAGHLLCILAGTLRRVLRLRGGLTCGTDKTVERLPRLTDALVGKVAHCARDLKARSVVHGRLLICCWLQVIGGLLPCPEHRALIPSGSRDERPGFVI